MAGDRPAVLGHKIIGGVERRFQTLRPSRLRPPSSASSVYRRRPRTPPGAACDYERPPPKGALLRGMRRRIVRCTIVRLQESRPCRSTNSPAEAQFAVEELLARAAERLRPRVSDGGALSAGGSSASNTPRTGSPGWRPMSRRSAKWRAMPAACRPRDATARPRRC